MNTIIKYSILIILLFFSIPSFSQYSLGFYGTMSYGSLNSDSGIIDFNPDWGGGFGVLYFRKSNPQINLVVQVGLEKVEWKANGSYFTLSPPQDSYWRRSSFNIYVGANSNLIDKSYLRFGVTLLPRVGYIFYHDFSPGIDPNNLALFITKRSSLLFGIDSKIDLQVNLSHNSWFHIRPGISTTYFDLERNLQGQLQLDLGFSWSF